MDGVVAGVRGVSLPGGGDSKGVDRTNPFGKDSFIELTPIGRQAD